MSRVARLALLLALTGCSGTDEIATPQPAQTASRSVEPTATPSPTPSPLPATTRCTNPAEGYRLAFPSDWFVADGREIEPCTFFDPQPLTLEPGTEATGVAVRLDVRDVPLEQARRDTGGEQEDRRLGGRAAVRATGTYEDETLLPAGTRFTTWLVDLDGRTLLLTADSAARSDYEANIEVLDAMAQTVQAA